MAIFDLFFKREKRKRGEYPDVYQYDELPQKLKIQIIHIWEETIEQDLIPQYYEPAEVKETREILQRIHKILLKELGVFSLPIKNGADASNYFTKISNFFLSSTETDIDLSVIEIMMLGVRICSTSHYKSIDVQEVVSELNQRFREHGVGYQYENDQIIRVDSEVIHTEVVKPALHLLNNPEYKGAEKEFLRAHEHYRNKHYSEAMIECLKAYESTLKIILEKNNKEYSPNATADELTGKVMQLELMPEFWKQHFKSLKNTLTAGVPTARNKLAGHGAGNESREISEYLISYVLHMTASAIVFLVKAEESLP